MKKITTYIFASWGICLLVFQWSCTSDTKTTTTFPNTPETVARYWQDLVDNNDFETAKKLSAPNAKDWLSWLGETLTDEMLKEDTFPPGKILEMTCVEKGNLAHCVYSFDDSGFVYEDTFQLIKENGQWLVDIPTEALEESDDLEKLWDEIKKTEAAQQPLPESK